MNTTVRVKGANWPKTSARGFLLGPVNNLGRFRWYYNFWPCLDQGFGLTCSKVDSSLRLVAVGRICLSEGSAEGFESQESRLIDKCISRLIAKCIREARPLCWP